MIFGERLEMAAAFSWFGTEAVGWRRTDSEGGPLCPWNPDGERAMLKQ